MTVFEKPFLFLRNPAGGVEDLAAMKAAGFQGVFCNIGDFSTTDWLTVRGRAAAQGMFCGPWARTGQGPGSFDPAVLDQIIRVADQWGSPLIVNSEKELDGTGATLTTLIAQKIGTRDGAISMEPWLYPTVDWKPIGRLPMLLQINPAENQASKDPAGCKWHAHQLGCECVYFTFGTAPPQEPSWYVLQAPYSLYTGDNASPFIAWTPTSTGFDGCQNHPAPPSVPLTPAQAPYTGPYYGPSNPKGPNKGPTAKALKRAMIRMQLMIGTLGAVDEHYNQRLEDAMKKFQRTLTDVASTGQYGRGSWDGIRAARVPAEYPHAGEYALDQAARQLLQEEAKPPVDPLLVTRTAITDFCKRAEANQADWHYTQARPYSGLGVPPEREHRNDCSSYVILAYYWGGDVANRQVPDPSGYRYTGYGNTWDDLDGHPHVSGSYLVGDLAHYDGHVTICKKAGDHLNSRWSSFGREQGPEQVLLYYRDDLRFVVRPPL